MSPHRQDRAALGDEYLPETKMSDRDREGYQSPETLIIDITTSGVGTNNRVSSQTASNSGPDQSHSTALQPTFHRPADSYNMPHAKECSVRKTLRNGVSHKNVQQHRSQLGSVATSNASTRGSDREASLRAAMVSRESLPANQTRHPGRDGVPNLERPREREEYTFMLERWYNQQRGQDPHHILASACAAHVERDRQSGGRELRRG